MTVVADRRLGEGDAGRGLRAVHRIARAAELSPISRPARRRIGALLRRHGLGPGDTVSLVMPNGLQTLRILLGSMANGLIVNPVNLLSQAEQMRYVLGHSDCKLVFVSPEWEAPVRGLLAGLGARSGRARRRPRCAALAGRGRQRTRRRAGRSERRWRC